MRFAQRSEGFHAHEEQQVEYFKGETAEELAVKVSEMVAKFAVRVVSISCWSHPQFHNQHYAVVVFEEEK